jgi:methionine sulfoxide reductase heme-binding subunit
MTIWYLARASGIVAMVAFTVATALGALASGRRRVLRADRLDRRVVLQYIHRGAALTGIALVAVHVTTILMDRFAHVPVKAVVIPMASGYRPLAVTLGTLALWAMAAVSISGMTRRHFARSSRATRIWRSVHLFSYLAWALTIGHALTSGTDAGTPAMTGLVIGCVWLVTIAVAVRLRSHVNHGRSRLTNARAELQPVLVSARRGS